ncbi:MAG: hypothetical protein H6607_11595 [Flavobacteriales bacterium]|nr:hypothetical protein [Flavobacteriales bacterium]
MLVACKDDNSVIEPYEVEVQLFYLHEGGIESKGYCGPWIVATDSFSTFLEQYMPKEIPEGIKESVRTQYWYKGKFKVYPETITCMDGWADPIPGVQPNITMHYVDILEWEVLPK